MVIYQLDLVESAGDEAVQEGLSQGGGCVVGWGVGHSGEILGAWKAQFPHRVGHLATYGIDHYVGITKTGGAIFIDYCYGLTDDVGIEGAAKR